MSRGTPSFDRIILGVGRIHRRFGTTDPDVQAGVVAAFAELERTGRYDTIRLIRDERIPLRIVCQYWRERRLDQLADLDLAEHVEPWKEWALRHANTRTVDSYLAQLRVLIPEGHRFPRSHFTRRYLSEAAAKLKCQGPTVRRYLAAWSSFAGFLLERDLLEHNPIRSLRWPRENPPREVWLPLEDVIRLVDAHEDPYRAFAALREGTGAEVSAALRVRRGDVDETRLTVMLMGTKTRHRQHNTRARQAVVDPWAMERLAAYIAAGRFTPHAPLFPGITEERALKRQKRVLKTLGLREDYRLHDCRHSYAVRKMKAGIEPQLIANNLGHANATMVLKIYGKYRPTAAEIARLAMRVER